jgi:Transglycosylase SLT domain
LEPATEAPRAGVSGCFPAHLTTAGRRRVDQCAALLLPSGLLFVTEFSAISNAQNVPVEETVAVPYSAYVAEASQRFRIPEGWIRAVMQVESAGQPGAVSTAGAMGLMQIMPDTWADLRVRYRLGRDPFDPRDNILGGTAYLREMYDRFGSPGFLAAYNAGPGRYRQHIVDGRPLPRETRDYIAKLLPMIGLVAADGTTTEVAPSLDWRAASLFVGRSRRNPTANPAQITAGSSTTSATPPEHDARSSEALFDRGFVVHARDE